MVKDIIGKLPYSVAATIADYKYHYKRLRKSTKVNAILQLDALKHRMSGYASALYDCGVLNDHERAILVAYMNSIED